MYQFYFRRKTCTIQYSRFVRKKCAAKLERLCELSCKCIFLKDLLSLSRVETRLVCLFHCNYGVQNLIRIFFFFFSWLTYFLKKNSAH